jgi:tRNA(Ile)-lysidine synthase
LPYGLRAERTARELQLSIPLEATLKGKSTGVQAALYEVPIPGKIDAPAFGLRLRIEFRDEARGHGSPGGTSNGRSGLASSATLRNWKPGDRVRLRYSGAPRKVKEVLERLRVTGSDRGIWPVLEVEGRIVWMRGVELEPDPNLIILAAFGLADSGGAGCEPGTRKSANDH